MAHAFSAKALQLEYSDRRLCIHLEDVDLFTDINKHMAFTMRDVLMYGYKLSAKWHKD